MALAIGQGKVQNGVMTFVSTDGKGFTHSIKTPPTKLNNIHTDIPNPDVVCEDINVPEFMMQRARVREFQKRNEHMLAQPRPQKQEPCTVTYIYTHNEPKPEPSIWTKIVNYLFE